MYLDNKFSRRRQGELQAIEESLLNEFKAVFRKTEEFQKKIQIKVIGRLSKNLTIKILSQKRIGRKKYRKL